MEVWDNKNSLEIVGPFEESYVLIGGYKVPYLTAKPLNGGMLHVTVDGRCSIDMSVADAEHFLPFVADCIAVAAGFTLHPRPGERETPVPRPLFQRMIGIITETTEPSEGNDE